MKERFPRPYSYQVGQFLARVIFTSVQARIEGAHNIPTDGPALLVSNHQSFLDPLFVSLGCPRRQIHFMAKEELFKVSTSRHMMLGLGAFPVNRNGPSKSTLAQVLRYLREGRCVCLFAEGTRSRDGKLQPFQAGFSKIAQKTKTPVVPIAIRGTRELFEEIQGVSLPLWGRYIGQPEPILRVGTPISASLTHQEIAEQTHRAVQALLEE